MSIIDRGFAISGPFVDGMDEVLDPPIVIPRGAFAIREVQYTANAVPRTMAAIGLPLTLDAFDAEHVAGMLRTKSDQIDVFWVDWPGGQARAEGRGVWTAKAGVGKPGAFDVTWVLDLWPTSDAYLTKPDAPWFATLLIWYPDEAGVDGNVMVLWAGPRREGSNRPETVATCRVWDKGASA